MRKNVTSLAISLLITIALVVVGYLQEWDSAGHKAVNPQVAEQTNKAGEYDRDEWHPYWADLDGDCQDSRQEALIAHSPVVGYQSAKNCRVAWGKWNDPYTGNTYSSPQKLDIDHIVPLSHAHRHGGAIWTKELKQQFANDQENLIPVYLGANRSKGDKAPQEWMPPNEGYGCIYLERWVRIKNKYQLDYGTSEAGFIRDYLRGNCNG